MQGDEQAAAKGSERGLTLVKLSLPQILIVVLLVLVGGYVGYLQYAGLVKKAQQVQFVADAEKLATMMGGRLIALGEQVARQARADSALEQAVAENDTDAIRLYEQGLQRYFSEAMRIRVITPAETNPDLSVVPPIGYACLDLARQAEAGTERPPLEMHLHGSDFAHLDLVRPITRGGKTIASLMVSFEPENVSTWLDELALEKGYVELQQGWDGPILGTAGNAGLKSETPAHRAMISGSSWQLSYWADDSIGVAEAQKLGFMTTFAITAAVIAVVMFFYALFVSATIKRELRGMAEFMLQSSQGKRFHSYPVRMVEMEQALGVMEQALHVAKPNEGIKEKAEKGDGGAADMMFVDFGEITVEEEDGDKPS